MLAGNLFIGLTSVIPFDIAKIEKNTYKSSKKLHA
jgi:hypothetical protein